jgi:predicted PurR-regulated permease PerM
MFGIMGMLIGVPTQAVIFDIINKVLNKLEIKRKHIDSEQGNNSLSTQDNKEV